MDELLQAVLEDLQLASEIEPDRGYTRDGDKIKVESYYSDGTPYTSGYISFSLE